MLDWFRTLSAGRKFIVVWNAVFALVGLPILVYALFFAGLPLPLNPMVMLGGIVLMATGGLLIAWRIAK